MPRFVGGFDHLWIFVIEPNSSGLALMVNLTSKKSHSVDLTVVLNVGDHPFITHETVVNFIDATDVNIGLIDQAVQMGQAKLHSPCSKVLLEKIQKGFISSPFTKNKLKTHLKSRLKIF